MLWHSRELSPAQDRMVAAHVEVCPECQREIEELDRFFGLAGQIGDSVATARRREGLSAVRRTRMRKLVASVVLVAASSVVLAVYLIRGAEVARADDILEKAVHAEMRLDNISSTVFLASHEVVCPIEKDAASESSASAAIEVADVPSPCVSLMGRLRLSGWTDGPLSATAYQRWRANLAERVDDIREEAAAVTLATKTQRGALRAVEMRVQMPHYHVLAVTFRFAEGGGAGAESIQVSAMDPAMFTARDIRPTAPLTTAPSTPTAPTPSAVGVNIAEPTSLDIVELRVRQVLRQYDLDRDVLLQVERGPDEVRVYGVADSASEYELLTRRLTGLSPLRIEISLPGAGATVPWKTFQGDREPAAFDLLNDLFPSNSAEREALVNSMSMASRRVAGIARMHEGTAQLAARLSGSVEQAEATVLLQELASQLFQQKQEIARGLATLTGPVDVSDRTLSAEQGRRLYDLVHMLVFVGKSDSNEPSEEIVQQLGLLLDRP